VVFAVVLSMTVVLPVGSVVAFLSVVAPLVTLVCAGLAAVFVSFVVLVGGADVTAAGGDFASLPAALELELELELIALLLVLPPAVLFVLPSVFGSALACCGGAGGD
jgi:hypothetical protein